MMRHTSRARARTGGADSTIHSTLPTLSPYVAQCKADYIYAKRTIRAWYLCLVGGATAVYLLTLTQPLWLKLFERNYTND